MAIHIRNKETDRLTRQLATQAGISIARAVHMAVANELKILLAERQVREGIANIRDDVAKRSKDPIALPKPFNDDHQA
jgi:hypothetical protein